MSLRLNYIYQIRAFINKAIPDLTDPSNLEALIKNVYDACPAIADRPDSELATALVFCTLVPKRDEAPLEKHYMAFLDELQRFQPLQAANPDWVRDFAVAYGCLPASRSGISSKESTARDNIWFNAIQLLGKLCRPPVFEVNRWLEHIIEDFPDERRRKIARDHIDRKAYKNLLNSDASILAQILINPEEHFVLREGQTLIFQATEEGLIVSGYATEKEFPCVKPGARFVLSVEQAMTLTLPRDSKTLHPGPPLVVASQDDDVQLRIPPKFKPTLKIGECAALTGPGTINIWHCTCGTQRCISEHRLSAWDPAIGQTLTNFLEAAIVKRPIEPLQIGSFKQRLTYGFYTTTMF